MNIGYIVSKKNDMVRKKKAIIDMDNANQSITYEELDYLTDNIARNFTRKGFKHGDIVMVMLENSIELQLCYFACFKVGIIIQPLNYHIGTEDVYYASSQCKPKVFITNTKLWNQKVITLRDKMPWIQEWYYTKGDGNLGENVKSFSELLIAGNGEISPSKVKDTDLGQLFFVFSNTGTKFNHRGVLLTHHVMEWHSYPYELMGLSEHDVVACILHPYNALTRAVLKAGATYVIIKDFSGERFIEACFQFGITFFGGTPEQFHDILNAAKRMNRFPETLKGCFCVGQLLDNECWIEFERVFKTKVYGGIGCKELGIFTLQKATEKSLIGSIGQVIPYMYYKIKWKDEEQGIGDLWIKSHSMISHYWIDGIIQENQTQDGWFETGYEVKKDAENNLFLTGNKKDTSISGLKRYFKTN